MGKDSGKSSVSFGKGFFRRTEDVRQSNDVRSVHSQVKQQAFKVSGDGVKRGPSHATSCGIRELNSEGFVIYNIPDKDSIYVAKSSSAADFGEEIEMKSVVSGEFIGGSESKSFTESEVLSESVAESTEYAEPADIFVNAIRRERFGEIDFNETIIITKPNTDFDDEIDFVPQVKAEAVEGLYVEGDEPGNSVDAGTSDSSSFCRTGTEDVAVTSASAVRMISSGLREPFVSEIPEATEIEDTESSESVASPPLLSVIIDPVADVMKLAVPGLCHDETVLCDLAADSDSDIPDDGLEAYDAKFSFMNPGLELSGTV